MRPNIVIFSAGESERNGNLKKISNYLSEKCNVYTWRDLFQTSNHIDSIALLPVLMKKIPSFDFAILLCGGYDTIRRVRDGKEVVEKSMRDNVLFEIGLASMALGLTRVIIVTEEGVHLPDDLVGINGNLAIKAVKFSNVIQNTGDEILEYIFKTYNDYFPVVVGAASSTAIGFFRNFVIRTVEKWNGTVIVNKDEVKRIPIENVRFQIYVPDSYSNTKYDESVRKLRNLTYGCIKAGDERDIGFRFYMEDDIMYIVDIPTSLKASYDTAKIILSISADDDFDNSAENRFMDKEHNLFYRTLNTLLNNESMLKMMLQKSSGKDDINSVYKIIVNNVKVLFQWF